MHFLNVRLTHCLGGVDVTIDWAATGNWMQALAGFAQAGAVVFVAYKGSDAFKQWRRQKIGERKLETAEQLLHVTYRVTRAFEAIRSPIMEGAALSRAEERLKIEQPGAMDKMEDRKRLRLIECQAIYDRVNAHREEWDELWSAMPRARALFGEDLEKQLKSLWSQRSAVTSAAAGRAEYASDDPELEQELERALWSKRGTFRKGRNEVDDAIASAAGRIEEILQPFLSETEVVRGGL